MLEHENRSYSTNALRNLAERPASDRLVRTAETCGPRADPPGANRAPASRTLVARLTASARTFQARIVNLRAAIFLGDRGRGTGPGQPRQTREFARAARPPGAQPARSSPGKTRSNARKTAVADRARRKAKAGAAQTIKGAAHSTSGPGRETR